MSLRLPRPSRATVEAWASWALLAAVSAGLVLHCLHIGWPVVDDAAISTAYGITLFEGHGFRATAHSQPIEAFSSPLWTILLGLSVPLKLAPIPFTQWLGIALGAMAVPALAWWGPASDGRPLRLDDLLAPALMASMPSLIGWLGSGMKTGLQVLLMAISGALLFRALRARRAAAAGIAVARGRLRPLRRLPPAAPTHPGGRGGAPGEAGPEDDASPRPPRRPRQLRLLARRCPRSPSARVAPAPAAPPPPAGASSAQAPVRQCRRLLPPRRHLIHPNDRAGLRHLCLYGARGPLCLERLSWADDGRLRYQPKRPNPDGSTHLVLTPLELLRRLAALIPPRASTSPASSAYAEHCINPCYAERQIMRSAAAGALRFARVSGQLTSQRHLDSSE